MSQLTFVFRSAPHTTSSGREGVDALLAASAYCDDIQVLFVGAGVLQLLQGQQPDAIYCKDYAPMLKLFDLYDIEQVFVSRRALIEFGLEQADLVIDAQCLTDTELQARLSSSGKVLTF